MEHIKRYEAWLNNHSFDEETRKELVNIKDDKDEIEDRFYRDLEFGTAGLRGKIGAGTNRMNMYIIARTTQGIAEYIKEQGVDYINRGVAIAYDIRHFSREFAKKTALVLAANGIKAYLFDDIRPTPVLSYAVRRLNTAAGVVITASHNPKDYNGYKVYWEDGSQILDHVVEGMMEKIEAITDFTGIMAMEEEEALRLGLLVVVGKELDDEYTEKVKELALTEEIDKDIKIVYTPLNGTGNILVRRVLRERGFTNVVVVPEQEHPDPDFKTVGYPNPEDLKAFTYAIGKAKEVGAELIFATDPDCDRVAAMARDTSGEYIALSGNQTGAILIKYMLETMKKQNTLSNNGYIVKSIVTGDMGKAIAQTYGVNTIETLTGFKHICGKVNELEEKNIYQFILGYEESIGYVAGTFVRDKDGVIASMLLCEACAYYKTQGKSLLEVLEELYQKHGYYQEKLISLVLDGIEGQKRISRMMEDYRQQYPLLIEGVKLSSYTDYEKQIYFDLTNDQQKAVDLPVSNVLRFMLEDGSWYAVRPSGTEPKIKIYMYSKGKTLDEALNKIKVMEEVIMNKLNQVV